MSDQALYGPRDDRPVTQASTYVTTRGIASMRDLRLDLFRGIALFLIFIDHIPGNVLSQFTLQSVVIGAAADMSGLPGTRSSGWSVWRR